jgi:predicted dithiol-disulfide oxidoreductase (DUF899 family)
MTTTVDTTDLAHHAVVNRDQWIAARKALLAQEKELTHLRDRVSAARRALPWVRVQKDYVFDTPQGPRRLADLFEGRRQLIVQHFMFGPDWEQGCPSCSYMADHIDGARVHLAHRDIAWLAVSRAPLAQIERFRQRMGWGFRWVSSFANDFNQDFDVSFTPQQTAAGEVYYNYMLQSFPREEAPGISVFYRNDAGEVFHTYSTYGRGVEVMMDAYTLMDLTPKGRDEDALPYPSAWLRHHDRYEPEPVAQAGCCSAHA